MMSAGILEELRVVGIAVVYGAAITFVYDLIRIFRRIIAHGNFWIGVEDFFFWIWTSLWSFSVLYRENDGNLRMYTIGSMVLGMILYHQLISEIFVKISAKVLKRVLTILLYPLQKLKINIIFCGKKLKNMMEEIIIKLKHYDR